MCMCVKLCLIGPYWSVKTLPPQSACVCSLLTNMLSCGFVFVSSGLIAASSVFINADDLCVLVCVVLSKNVGCIGAVGGFLLPVAGVGSTSDSFQDLAPCPEVRVGHRCLNSTTLLGTLSWRRSLTYLTQNPAHALISPDPERMLICKQHSADEEGLKETRGKC